MQLSRICFVPLSYIALKGEQVKVFAQIVRYGHKMGYVMPDVTFGKANKLAAPSLLRQHQAERQNKENMAEPGDEFDDGGLDDDALLEVDLVNPKQTRSADRLAEVVEHDGMESAAYVIDDNDGYKGGFVLDPITGAVSTINRFGFA